MQRALDASDVDTPRGNALNKNILILIIIIIIIITNRCQCKK